MVSKEEQFICCFETGKKYTQKIFEELLKTTLNYKYNCPNNYLTPVSEKDITEAIFCLSSKDSITLFNKNINGQKIKELFITTIYLSYLDIINQNKQIFISIPFIEESHDVSIYIADKGSPQYIKDGNKCKLPDKFTSYSIQIKEEFNYEDYKNNYNILKKGLDVKSLEKKSSSYDELVLIFMRNYRKYNTSEARPFLEKNKNVGLICMPSLEQKEIPIVDGNNEKSKIILDEHRYNFFLFSGNQNAHIKFNRPNFLIPKNNKEF